MKKYLTLKNVILASVAFIGILFFGLSFLATTSLYSSGEGYTFFGSVWGAYGVQWYESGDSGYNAMSGVGVFPLPLIGFILLLVGAASALVVKLFVKVDDKIKNYILYGCAGLLLIGGIFQLFNAENFYVAFAKLKDTTVDQAKEFLNSINLAPFCGVICVLSGIFTFLSAGAIAVSTVVKDKPLVKE